MTQHAQVPVIVVSRREDDAEAISQTLRNGGCAAHCQWLGHARDLPATLESGAPELLFLFDDGGGAGIGQLSEVRDRLAPGTPLLVVCERTDEDTIAEALAHGAQDQVSLTNRARLQAVALRELNHYRQARALQAMQASTEQLEEQLATLVNESADAIMLVQEGILVDVNPAWLDLLGYADPDDLVGTPVLDVFVESDHVAVKGAMVATRNAQWSGDAIKVKALGSDGSAIAVEAELESAVFDDEPCVRISLALDQSRADNVPREIVANSERHPLTGFFRRQRFLQEMEKQLDSPSRGGLWMLAYIKPDSIAELREQIGPLQSDDLLLEFARMLQDHARQKDVYGQFGGDLFMVLMPRGTARDALAWAQNLRKAVAARVFAIGDKSLSLTCTVGLARFQSDSDDLPSLILKAQKAYLAGTKEGGNRCMLPDLSDQESGHQKGDTIYVKKIKGALMQDNFRLVFQPVANLSGESQQMFDVLLRMMDVNREVMPAVFLPAARRNGLMKNIDRWVIANAMRFCADQRPAGLFIRLSSDSLTDATLVDWVGQQLAASDIRPGALIFQINEADIEARLLEAKSLATALKRLHCQIALEHFGVSQQPLQTLEHVPLDYLKIDGSLMEGIASDKAKQETVRNFIEAADEKRIATVAERVEDANTMAVLWQLGIQYIQGFYVQGPEEIVLESA